MGWKVILSRSAEADLASIVRYIARDNPDAAVRVGEGLVKTAAQLADFPEMSRIVPEFKRPELREVIHRNHRIVYRLDSQSPILVWRARHTRD